MNDQLVPGASSFLGPLGEWEQKAGRVGATAVSDMARAAWDLITYPSRAMQQGVTTSQAVPWAFDVASTMVGAPGGRGGLGSGIRAYHGSPYDFERFDISKIGTGEGGQAYGHGLYFAENPLTAESYKKAVYRKTPITKEEAQRFAATRTPIRQGRMYETNIRADPSQFLDYDRMVSQQSPEVRAALDRLWGTQGQEAVTGGEAYRTLGYMQGKARGEGEPYYDVAASKALSEAGVPGLRYLDQGSRGAGEGTLNYVLFRDDIIDIVKKYGFAGLTALPPAVTAAFSQDMFGMELTPQQMQRAMQGQQGSQE